LTAHSTYLSSVFEGGELAMQMDPLTSNGNSKINNTESSLLWGREGRSWFYI